MQVDKLPVRSLETHAWVQPFSPSLSETPSDDTSSDGSDSVEEEMPAQGSSKQLAVLKEYTLSFSNSSDNRIFIGHKLHQATSSLATLYSCLLCLRHALVLKRNDDVKLWFIGIGQILLDHCPTYKLNISHEDQPKFNSKVKKTKIPKSKKAKVYQQEKIISEEEKTLLYCYRLYWALGIKSMDLSFTFLLEMIPKYTKFWSSLSIDPLLAFSVCCKVFQSLSPEFNDVLFLYGCLGRFAAFKKDVHLLKSLLSSCGSSLDKLNAWLLTYSTALADSKYRKIPIECLECISKALKPAQLLLKNSLLNSIGASILRLFLGYFKQSLLVDFLPAYKSALYMLLASPVLLHFYSTEISADLEGQLLQKILPQKNTIEVFLSAVYLLESLRQSQLYSLDTSSLIKVSKYTLQVQEALFDSLEKQDEEQDKRRCILHSVASLALTEEDKSFWKPKFEKLLKSIRNKF